MEQKDQDLDVTLDKRVQQVLDDVEEKVTLHRLEQEQVKEHIHYVLDLGLRSARIVAVGNHLVVVFNE